MRKPKEAAASWLVAKGKARKPAASIARCPEESGKMAQSPATFCSAELASMQAWFT